MHKLLVLLMLSFLCASCAGNKPADSDEQRSTPLYSYDQATLKRLGLNVTFEDNMQAVEASGGELAVQIFEISADELAELIEANGAAIRERLNGA